MLSRKSYVLAAALWLAMVAVFFWPVLFQGKVLAPLDIMKSLLRPWATAETVSVHNAYPYDAISQYLPYDWSVSESLKQDGYIGWNPYTHSGSSIVENTMICPGDWHHQLYRFLPFWPAWNFGIVLQFTLAGLGMLVLLRDQKIPASYALLGVVAFGFYSQSILWIYHRWLLGAMCWTPWIVWSVLRARKAGRIVDLPAIVFIGLAFRGGHLQACIFVILLVAAIAATDWWQSPQRWTVKKIVRILLPYAVCGVLGAIVALDVIVATVPALLHGKRHMDSRSWTDVLIGIPTLITSIFPTVMGTPQGLDLMKMFRSDLFSIKFMGASGLLLAVLGLCRRHAPLPAKGLLVMGLLLPFTPADQWLYSRFTVVFALGGAWLASWYLTTISAEPATKLWRRSMILLSLVAGAWLLGSTLVSVKQAWVETKLHEVVVAKLPVDKSSRTDWMLSRADRFLQDSLIWAPHNLAMLSLIGVGLFACSRIHCHSRNAPRFAMLLACCTFGEIWLFSSTWITFSDPPDGVGPYSEPPWASRLKHEIGNGTILSIDRSDFDYMQLNTPSVYGIRFAEGYETVTPHRINPVVPAGYDPQRYADSGISHILVSPGKDPGTIPGWEKVVDSKDFILYRNSVFRSICNASLVTGGTIPLFPKLESANRRSVVLPANVGSVILMESFNPGWKFSIAGGKWQPVHESQLKGIEINLANPSRGEATQLALQYRPAYQPACFAIMAVTATGLFGFSLRRMRGMKRTSAAGSC